MVSADDHCIRRGTRLGGLRCLCYGTKDPFLTRSIESIASLSTLGIVLAAAMIFVAPGTTYAGSPPGEVVCDVLLTHSLDQSIDLDGSLICSYGGVISAENSFYRSFDLEWFGIQDELHVTSVDIGIEVVEFNDYPFEIRLYVDIDGGEPHLADLELIATAGGVVPETEAPTILNVPVAVDVAPGATLVAEFHFPDGQALDPPGKMRPGFNSLGQTAPTYWKSVDCDITEIVDICDVAKCVFEGLHLVMNVHGIRDDCLGTGDFDFDGDVDFDDLAALRGCYTGEDAGPITPDCYPGDFDFDLDIDRDDYFAFREAFTGPK